MGMYLFASPRCVCARTTAVCVIMRPLLESSTCIIIKKFFLCRSAPRETFLSVRLRRGNIISLLLKVLAACAKQNFCSRSDSLYSAAKAFFSDLIFKL